MSRELRIGIFVGTAVVILAAFIFVVGDMSVLFKKKGYAVTALFDSAEGLEKRAVVKMSGVAVGFIDDIRLERRKARITLTLYPGVAIPKDSKATTAMLGLLGEKYLDIIPGDAKENIGPGGELAGETSVGIERIGGLLASVGTEVRDAGGAIKEMLGPQTRENLNRALENLAAVSTDLKGLLGRNEGDIREAVRGARGAFQNLDKKAEEVASGLRDTIALLKDVAAENRDNLKINLEKIKDVLGKMEESLKLLNASLEKVGRGEGTLGRIIQDPELYTKAEQTLDDVRSAAKPLTSLRGRLDLRADYFGRSALLRASVLGGLWFTPRLFVDIGLVRDPWETAFKFSLTGGYRFGNFVSRAGLIESEFGLGLDYRAPGEALSLSAEGFDFNRPDGAHFRVYSRFSPAKHLYVVAGVDDFSLAARREFFFGLGLELR